MSEQQCTCHCGGSMFYRHLHAESCALSRDGAEAPVSVEQALRAENARLRSNLVNCVARLEAYYGEDYPAVRDAKAALQPEKERHEQR